MEFFLHILKKPIIKIYMYSAIISISWESEKNLIKYQVFLSMHLKHCKNKSHQNIVTGQVPENPTRPEGFLAARTRKNICNPEKPENYTFYLLKNSK